LLPNLDEIKTIWHNKVAHSMDEASIKLPEGTWFHSGGKNGLHSEHLGFILAEMQYLQKSYPGASW
jgi:ring-1,2-phenylacetyl-CoA epoxidase subunit PaaC